MRIKKLVIVFTVVMLGFFLLFGELYLMSRYEGRDILRYNDMMFKIREELESGADIEEVENRYSCSIVLSKELDDPELASFYRNEAMILDLTLNGEYVGKVAWQDSKERYESFGKGFFRTAFIMWALLLVFGYVLFFLIYLSFVRPTKDLTRFSTELAKGNLDVSLPIRRFNPFGGFTEAFDLMREELLSSRARRIETEIARKELVSSLSHDIKTPVAVIEATCEVLDVKLKRELEADPERTDLTDISEKIATISSKAHTISSLMTDLMNSNMEDSEKIAVRPNEEFSSLIEDYFVKLQSYGNIILKNHIPKCLVYMDRQRMEQVIDNIVGNSRKYAGTDIIVSFEETDDIIMPDGSHKSFIKITVRDSGPGVSEEDLPLIAQKYYRGANARKAYVSSGASAESVSGASGGSATGGSSVSGTAGGATNSGEHGNSGKTCGTPGYGLGLYLVKLYMQKMGGDMEYYNDNGFTVCLMLKKV